MDVKIIYEDDNVLVVDKPAGISVYPDDNASQKNGTYQSTYIGALIEKYPELKNTGEAPRYGIAHRLDKDTSGVLLVAKTNESLIFLQNQFINRRVDKKYVCLVEGDIKEDTAEINTLIGRSPQDPRKQKAYPLSEAKTGRREAISEYKVLQRFEEYTLLEVQIKTGRKHQIRCHLSYLQHPIAGDKLYGFKNSPTPDGLTRQFLHASYLKIQLPNGKTEEFKSDLPEELQKTLKILNSKF